MPKSLKDLLSELMGTRDGVLPSVQAFPPIDGELIAKHLQIDQRAATAGSTILPPSTSDIPEAIESEIASDSERPVRTATDEYISHRELYDGPIRRTVL